MEEPTSLQQDVSKGELPGTPDMATDVPEEEPTSEERGNDITSFIFSSALFPCCIIL